MLLKLQVVYINNVYIFIGNRGIATSFFDDSQDAGIAGPLKTILKQAGQNIPDFLASTGGGYSSYESNSFGGTDFRNESFGTSTVAAEPEEDW